MSAYLRFGFIAIFLVVALVASACGGDDSGGDDATTTTTAADSGGNDGGGGSDATTTTTEAAPVSGDSDSAWCRELRRVSEEGNSPGDLNFLTATSEELKKAFEAILAAFQEAADSAPPEIDSDVDVMLAAFETFVDKGNEAGWVLSIMASDPEFAEVFEDDAVERAADRVDSYTRDVCGVDFSTLGDTGAVAPPSGGGDVDPDDPVGIVLNALQLPPALFSEEQIACITEELGEEFVDSITPDWTPTPDSLEALFTAVDACGINLG